MFATATKTTIAFSPISLLQLVSEVVSEVLPFRFGDVGGNFAGSRDLPPHLQYDVAIVIVDVLLIPDSRSSVHLIDQPLEIHRHRVPATARVVTSPGRSFGRPAIEKRDVGENRYGR